MTTEQHERYSRQLSLDGFGKECQMRLLEGSVLIIGLGGLGSPVALYLAASGVGRIGLADGDRVSLSNLQRQVIHTTADVGRLKIDSAAEKMLAINPDLKIERYAEMVDESNVGSLIADYDFVIDATDSLKAKFLINDECVAQGKALCHGAIWRWEGQVMTIVGGSRNLRSLFPDGGVEEQGEPRGPIGVLPGVVGTIQAAEAIKYLSGAGELLTDRLLRIDTRTMSFETISLC